MVDTLLCKRTYNVYGTLQALDRWSFGFLTDSNRRGLTDIHIFVRKYSGAGAEPLGSATLSLYDVDGDYLPTSEIYSTAIADLDALAALYYEYSDKRYYDITIPLSSLGWPLSKDTKYSLVLTLDTPQTSNYILINFRTTGGASQPSNLPTSNIVLYKNTYYKNDGSWIEVSSDDYKPNLIINASFMYLAEALTRVTGIIHRWSPGNYTMEVSLGAVTDFGIPMVSKKPLPTVPPEPQFICTICGASFPTLAHLAMHSFLEHYQIPPPTLV